jgi:hypothetical protein
MKQAIAGVALVAGLIMAGSAAAENYRLVAGTDDTVVFINTDRTVVDGDIRTIWTTIVLKDVRVFDGKNGRYSMERWDVDCRKNRQRQQTLTLYTDDGDMIGSESLDGDWKDMPPHSLGDAVIKGACLPAPSTAVHHDFDTARLLTFSRRFFVLGDLADQAE